MSQTRTLSAGAPAPDFTLPGRSGRTVSLHDFRGKKNVLVYFYPKDDTPGCTKEACSLRDGWSRIQGAGIEVLGISRDDSASHNAFASKYNLPFELLTDADHSVHEAYGAWGEKTWPAPSIGVLRKSFLIGKNGNIRHVFNRVDVEHHAEEVLKAMESSNPPGSNQPPAPPKPATPAAPSAPAPTATPTAPAPRPAAPAVPRPPAPPPPRPAVPAVAPAAPKPPAPPAPKPPVPPAAKPAAPAAPAAKKAAPKKKKKAAPKKKKAAKKKRRAAPRRRAAKRTRKAARRPARKSRKTARRKGARKAAKKRGGRKRRK